MAEHPDLIGGSAHIPVDLGYEIVANRRYRPAASISCGAMAVHHILPSDLCECEPSSSFQIPEDCGYLIGHSIDMDWKAAGSPAHVKRICTHAIAQWVYP